MANASPFTVRSPEDLVIVHDKGPVHPSWSIATLKLDHRNAVGIRWNGTAENSDKGMAQSQDQPSWFIVPDEIADAVLRAASALERHKDRELLAGYQRMATATEREEEALDWSGALIGDALETRPGLLARF